MVQITIDTDKASEEDIEKTIEYLRRFIKEPTEGAFNMFSEESTPEQVKEKKEQEFDIKPIFY